MTDLECMDYCRAFSSVIGKGLPEGGRFLLVVFDEAEVGGDGTRVQNVLGLARQSSSESDARTLKGTQHGASMEFKVRSRFCFASIAGAVNEESDKSRVCVLSMIGKSQTTIVETLSI